MIAPQIRPARETDVPAILDVVEAAYRGSGGWTTEEGLVSGDRTSAPEVLTLIRDDSVLLLVAEDRTDPAGAQTLGCCYTRREADRAELGLFAVDPRRQGSGVGRRLIEEQCAALAGQGVREIELHVHEDRSELIAWYGRRGFSATGSTVPFPSDATLLSRPDARFAVLVRSLTH